MQNISFDEMEIKKICSDKFNFTASISLTPPFVSRINNETRGIFVAILNDVIHTCCHENASLGITRVAMNPQHLYEGISDDEHIVMPYSESIDFKYKIMNSSFLPVVSSPGAVLLVRTVNQLSNLFSILTVSWQLLVIIMITCCLAGIIIWLLERLRNKDELPRRFHRGFWEGVWWSFISMTTVGYGDITPKSVPGRLFAMLWIIIGMCIFSVFTATLTAAITQEEQNMNTVHGRKIGVLNGTDDWHLSALLGATPVVYSNIESMISAVPFDLKNDLIEGILIDYVFLSQISHITNATTLKTLLHIAVPRTHGVLLQHIDPDLMSCFQKVGRKKKYDSSLAYAFTGNKLFPSSSGVDAIDRWLTISNVHLAIYAACLVGLVLMCLLWEFLYWRPRNNHNTNEENKTANELQDTIHYNGNGLCSKCRSQITNVFT